MKKFKVIRKAAAGNAPVMTVNIEGTGLRCDLNIHDEGAIIRYATGLQCTCDRWSLFGGQQYEYWNGSGARIKHQFEAYSVAGKSAKEVCGELLLRLATLELKISQAYPAIDEECHSDNFVIVSSSLLDYLSH